MIPPGPLSLVSQIPYSLQSLSARLVHQRFRPANWRGYQTDGATQEETWTGGRFPENKQNRLTHNEGLSVNRNSPVQ